jgi:hypothetical protein
MKKVIKLLLAALLPFAIMSCSDSSSDEQSLSDSFDYKTFSSARSAWKEPASYSYTVHFDSPEPFGRTFDVKVVNGESTLFVKSNQNGVYGNPESESEYTGSWDIKTITGIFNSIEKLTVPDPDRDYYMTSTYDKNAKNPTEWLASLKNVKVVEDFNDYYIRIRYDKVNNLSFPTYVCRGNRKHDPSVEIGYRPDVIEIKDFKILSE